MSIFKTRMIKKFSEKLIEDVEEMCGEGLGPTHQEAIKRCMGNYFLKTSEVPFNRDLESIETAGPPPSETRAEIKVLDELAKGGDKSPVFKVSHDPILFYNQDSFMFILALDPNKVWKNYDKM